MSRQVFSSWSIGNRIRTRFGAGALGWCWTGTAKVMGGPLIPSAERASKMNFNVANAYVLNGVISGTVDTTSFGGTPIVSLRFKGGQVVEAELQDSIAGIQVTAPLSAQPDQDAQTLLMLLPQVDVADTPVAFAGVALVVTARGLVQGSQLVGQVVQSYEIHLVTGTASFVVS
jgi:hypothetical protein